MFAVASFWRQPDRQTVEGRRRCDARGRAGFWASWLVRGSVATPWNAGIGCLRSWARTARRASGWKNRRTRRGVRSLRNVLTRTRMPTPHP